MADKVPFTTLGMGRAFWVEPEDADRIPVRIAGPATWGMVHGVLEVPCQRLDTLEDVVVDIHVAAEVEPYGEVASGE